ncbi:MAG: hypothetical protein AB7N71_09795 [Phycisphaerae bacterium]
MISYQDPYFPETRNLNFRRVFFYEGHTGDRHVVADSRSADGAETESSVQMLHLHLIWKPRPGRTYANRTTSDATFVFVTTNPQATVAYEGTGFVYPEIQRDGTLRLKIENGRLRPKMVSGTSGDAIADLRIVGELFAQENRAETINLRRWVDRVAAGFLSEDGSRNDGTSREATLPGQP